MLSRSSTAIIDTSVSPEEARRRALTSLSVLDGLVAARDGERYKDKEKECALHLSLVIRHIKASPAGRPAAEGLLQETQNMVAAGRAAVGAPATDEALLAEYRKLSSRVQLLVSSSGASSDDPPKPQRAPPTSPRANAAGAAAASSTSPRSAAVAEPNSKIQVVSVRKTTAAADLMRSHGFNPAKPQEAPVSVPPPSAPAAPPNILSPREQRRALKEQKKLEKQKKEEDKKSDGKRTIGRRRKVLFFEVLQEKKTSK